jgi:hypothetical protein
MQSGAMAALVMAALFGVVIAQSAAPPVVYRDPVFEVKEQLGVQYAQGILCDAKPCSPCNDPNDGRCSCQNPEPGSAGSPQKGCPHPVKYNLTLDLYTPVGNEVRLLIN